MKKAYIILAHKYPEQLCRLIARLNDDDSYFFVHIDEAADITAFTCLESFGKKVQLVKRVQSTWATYGQVQSTLNAMEAVQQSGILFGSISLLSGQDYPIKSNQQISAFFQQTEYAAFLEYFTVPDYKRWPKNNGGMYRINKYFFGLKPYQKLLSKSLNFLSTYLSFFARKMPLGMNAYLGSTWWSMNLYSLNYILNFVKANPRYVSFQRYGFGCDELFFHMILLNATDTNIKGKISDNNLRFIHWKSTDTAHPEILTQKNFEAISKSDMLFARKFDAQSNAAILDLIDQKIA